MLLGAVAVALIDWVVGMRLVILVGGRNGPPIGDAKWVAPAFGLGAALMVVVR